MTPCKPGDVVLLPFPCTPEEQRAAGLPKPSIVKCGKLVTIDQRLIRKRLGRLPDAAVQQIRHRLAFLLG